MQGILFIGGDKWKKILGRIAEQEVELKVGVFAGAEYNGEDGTKAGQSVAEVAHWQEFGTTRTVETEDGEIQKQIIPPRPFMSNTSQAKRDTWKKEAANLIRNHPEGIVGAFNIMGDNMAKDIIETIEAGIDPPLKKSTLKARGKHGLTSTTPLMGTMQLIKSISFEVKS